MTPTDSREFAMLRILHATLEAALDAFRAADNPIDRELVTDLERVSERTRAELTRMANPS